MLAPQSSRTVCHSCGHSHAPDALFCPNCGTARRRDTTDDALIGATIGDRYLLHERIGMGASGTIYRAEHVTLRRRVAVKVLHHELSRDDLAIERFRRQATTVGELDNEHIVQIHDFGRTPDGRLYIAMEYLEGETLEARLGRLGRLEIEETVDILTQLGEALMESHAIGYVHRDLRPRNLFLAKRRGVANFLKLLDFGLSKLVAAEGEAASTSLGMTFGDPHYMSPEQARGDPIDRRADIYSMGCIAYQMLTGEPPFVGEKVFDVLAKHVEEAPVPLGDHRPDAPAWLEELVAVCLAKAPEDRFITVFRLVEALREGLAGGELDSERARRRETSVPASVSRAMERLGDRLNADGRIEDADDTRSAPGNRTQLGVGVGVASRRSSARIVSPAIDPAPTQPSPAPDFSDDEAVPSEVAAEPTPPPRPRLDPEPLHVTRREAGAHEALDSERISALRAAEAAEAAKVDDLEEPDEGEPEESLEAAGAEDEDEDDLRVTRRRDSRPGDPAARSAAGISSAWYADGDALADSGVELDDEELARLRAARTKSGASLSGTDEVYFEESSNRMRWVLGAVGGAVAVVLGVVLFTGGGDDGKPAAAVSADAAELAKATPAPVEPAPVEAAPAPDAAAAAPAPAHHDPEPKPKPKPKPKPAHREPKPKPHHDEVAVKPKPKPHHDEVAVKPKPKPDPEIEPAGAGDEDAKKADFFAQVGRKHLASGNIPGAAKEFRKALELDPKNARAVTGLGEIALRTGSYAAAVKHLERAARLRRGSARIHALLGDAYLGAGNKSAAAASFKQALRLDPDSARARRGLAEAGGS